MAVELEGNAAKQGKLLPQSPPQRAPVASRSTSEQPVAQGRALHPQLAAAALAVGTRQQEAIRRSRMVKVEKEEERSTMVVPSLDYF